MGAISDIWKSERGLLTVVGLICITVLAAIGKLPIDRWQTLTQWIFGFYVGGKTLTGIATAIAGRPADPTVAVTPPANPGGGTITIQPSPAPVVSTATLATVALVAMFALGGCKPEYIRPIADDTVDCTKANQGAILELITTFASDVANGGGLNWAVIESQAIAAGKEIGGCAISRFVQRYLAPAPGISAPSPDAGLAASGALDDVRGHFGGKVEWDQGDGHPL